MTEPERTQAVLELQAHARDEWIADYALCEILWSLDAVEPE